MLSPLPSILKDEHWYGSIFLDLGTQLMVISELMIAEPSTGTVLHFVGRKGQICRQLC